MNHYANKKSAAESMLDIALLMANASQLKAVIEQGPGFAFFVPLVVLISISLVLQIGVGVLLIFLGVSLGWGPGGGGPRGSPHSAPRLCPNTHPSEAAGECGLRGPAGGPSPGGEGQAHLHGWLCDLGQVPDPRGPQLPHP